MNYSQNGEEAHILNYLGGQTTGRLLDIGAFDGKTFSNTLALIERGWSGVMVEPNPTSLAALINLHHNRPNVEIVASVLMPEPTLFTDFFTCGDAVSTSLESMTKIWKDTPFRKVRMPGVGIQQFCDAYPGPYDFVSLDVEDNTLSLAYKMTKVWNCTRLVCIEHTVGNVSVKLPMEAFFVKAMGFRLIADVAENFIFGR